MGTTPVTPAPTQDLATLIHTQFAALAHKQVAVSYALIGTLILVLALAGVGGWFGLKSYEKQVAAAQVIELRYEAAQKDFTIQLAAHDAERTADAKAAAVLIAQVAARDKQAPPPVVQAGLKPDATTEQVNLALEAAVAPRHPDMGSTTVEGANVVLTTSQAQDVALDEVDLTTVSGDLNDTKSLLTLANGDKASLNKDLTQCQAINVDSQKALDAYKKISVKSKWQKFLTGVEKVGILAAGVAIGHGI